MLVNHGGEAVLARAPPRLAIRRKLSRIGTFSVEGVLGLKGKVPIRLPASSAWSDAIPQCSDAGCWANRLHVSFAPPGSVSASGEISMRKEGLLFSELRFRSARRGGSARASSLLRNKYYESIARRFLDRGPKEFVAKGKLSKQRGLFTAGFWCLAGAGRGKAILRRLHSGTIYAVARDGCRLPV